MSPSRFVYHGLFHHALLLWVVHLLYAPFKLPIIHCNYISSTGWLSFRGCFSWSGIHNFKPLGAGLKHINFWWSFLVCAAFGVPYDEYFLHLFPPVFERTEEHCRVDQIIGLKKSIFVRHAVQLILWHMGRCHSYTTQILHDQFCKVRSMHQHHYWSQLRLSLQYRQLLCTNWQNYDTNPKSSSERTMDSTQSFAQWYSHWS